MLHTSIERRVMRALVVIAPAKTSHELDLLRAMPNWTVEVVAAAGVGPEKADHRLDARRVPILGSPERWTAALAWYRRLETLEVERPDVVISFELHSAVGIQVARYARSRRLPHVVSIFETLANNPLYSLPPWRWFLRNLSQSAQLLLCFTERALLHAIELGCPPSRCAVVHPGIDVRTFHPRPEGLRREAVVLFVGELRADKGVMDVLAACERARARRRDLRLVIAGTGPLAAQVDRLATERRYIDYLGRVPREDVAQLMRNARVLAVAPHHRRFWEEQFGFVYVEAMATGLPIVTTRCGAIPEVVPPDNAIVPEGDIGGLAESIDRMCGPSGAEVGRANRTTAERRYDVERQGRELASVLAHAAADSWRGLGT
jgi:glycosyltransferase involved in cell wall biosynthesis